MKFTVPYFVMTIAYGLGALLEPETAQKSPPRLFAIGGAGSPTKVEYLEIGPSDAYWKAAKDLPTNRAYTSATSVDGCVFVVGGYDDTVGLQSSLAISLMSAGWTPSTHMPTARSTTGVCSLQGKIYVMGGFNSSTAGGIVDSNERYDPAKKRWDMLPNLPSKRDCLAVEAVGDTVYVIGGFDGSGKLDTVIKFNTTSQLWSTSQEMLARRACPCSAVINDTIYVIGGFDDVRTHRSVEAYDTRLKKWSRPADLNLPRQRCGAVAVDGKIYVVGGYNNGDRKTAHSTEVYDPVTDAWTILKAHTVNPFYNHGVAVEQGHGCSSPPPPMKFIEKPIMKSPLYIMS